jgi:hypothetical protein
VSVIRSNGKCYADESRGTGASTEWHGDIGCDVWGHLCTIFNTEDWTDTGAEYVEAVFDEHTVWVSSTAHDTLEIIQASVLFDISQQLLVGTSTW